MDFEAELAAFSAEVETLAEKVQVEPSAAAGAATNSAPVADKAGKVTPASATSASATPASSSLKRKAAPADHNPTSSSPHKKAHISSSSAAPSSTSSAPSRALAAAAAPIVPAVAPVGAYSSVVAADLEALKAKREANSTQAAASAASAAAASSSSAAAAASSTSAASSAAAAAASTSSSSPYIPGQIYNGYLATFHPTTGEPMWVPATPEQIAAAAANAVLDAKAAAEAAAVAEAEAKKQAKKDKKAADKAAQEEAKKKHLRSAAGIVWEDPTLEEWPENDYRIFCGDLGNEVTDTMLSGIFQRWPSFAKAKVIRDKRTGKSKGFGFASFLNPEECVEALKEANGKYCGNRPLRLKKSDWTKREVSADKSWTARHNQFGNSTTRGNKKLHMY